MLSLSRTLRSAMLASVLVSRISKVFPLQWVGFDTHWASPKSTKESTKDCSMGEEHVNLSHDTPLRFRSPTEAPFRCGIFCKLCDPASAQKGKLCGKLRQILPNYAVIMRRILVDYAANYAANYYFPSYFKLAICHRNMFVIFVHMWSDIGRDPAVRHYCTIALLQVTWPPFQRSYPYKLVSIYFQSICNDSKRPPTCERVTLL